MHSNSEIQHFLEFSMRFLTFTKCHFHKEQELRTDSLAFHALISLHALSRQELTMSELASEMMITAAAYPFNQRPGKQGTGRTDPQSIKPPPGLYPAVSRRHKTSKGRPDGNGRKCRLHIGSLYSR